ncbi:hypothetical protein [Nocardioides convexus]|uniref:hypothetical protein n=1 Tax=Nocardioides convexus TaxID=2712224 RepID=UPI0024183A91|nr:hypothetical protein [Nocardioides convexus]
MRAVVLDAAPAPPEGLVIRDLPLPRPAPGQVLVRVRAFGLNRSESAHPDRAGRGRHLPAGARHRGHRRGGRVSWR